MQSSSNELSSSVSDRVKYKKKEVNTCSLNSFPYVGFFAGCEVMWGYILGLT